MRYSQKIMTLRYNANIFSYYVRKFEKVSLFFPDSGDNGLPYFQCPEEAAGSLIYDSLRQDVGS